MLEEPTLWVVGVVALDLDLNRREASASWLSPTRELM
jgi:hypothetical protein